MATITVQTPNASYTSEGTAAQFNALSWTACATTGDTFVIPGRKVLVLWRNSGASTRTITIPSSADPHGRKADIAATNIAAGAIYGRFFEPLGWEQTLGSKNIEFTANHAEVLVAVLAVG
jgi:hypothetical protein